jgi:hypothetical protein
MHSHPFSGLLDIYLATGWVPNLRRVCWGHAGSAGERACCARSLQGMQGSAWGVMGPYRFCGKMCMLCAQSPRDAGQRLGCAEAMQGLQDSMHNVPTCAVSRGCKATFGVCWGHAGFAGEGACCARSRQGMPGSVWGVLGPCRVCWRACMLCAQSPGDARQRLGCAGAMQGLQERVHVVRAVARGCTAALGVCWGHAGLTGERACCARCVQGMQPSVGGVLRPCRVYRRGCMPCQSARAVSKGCTAAFGVCC